MALKIKVFTAEEALAAAKADVSKVLTIEKKKVSKLYKGTEFLNAQWNIGASVKKEGWYNIEDVELTDGIADPANKDDKRNEFDGIRLHLQTTLSRCGPFGEFLMTLNPQWRKQVTDMGNNNVIDIEGRKIHDLLQLNLSRKNEKNPGGKIEDPIIRFQVEFYPFPAKYPHSFLRGLPKTQFFDARTEYKDEKGVTQYKIATVTRDDGSEEPITEANVHKFVTAGSKIVKARLMMHSVPVSSSWVSLPIIANRVVLMPGGAGGFSDDEDCVTATASVKAALTQDTSKNTQPDTQPQPQQQPDQAENTQPTNDELTDVLAAI